MADDRARLNLLYDLGKRLASMHDADELITHAAHQIREFFQAEGCSVLLLDPSGREFRFPVFVNRTGSATNPGVLSKIGFPAGRGVAGWVLEHGEGIWVPDTERDERFYKGVDQLTGAVTRSLMCVPLRTASGMIGVVEVMNPVVTAIPEDDVNFLAAISSDVAAAYEKADLQRRIHREVSELRYIGLAVGIALITVGLLVASFAAFSHLARALPISRLLLRAEVLGGIGAAAGGTALLLAIRRAAIRRARGD
jgi:phosphoserine phosphatase RsbU/P